MKKEPNIFLRHILESIGHIERFSEGLTKEKLKSDDMVQSAIIRKLEIIGEAVKNLSKEFRDKHPEVPWKDIAGTRDKIIHHYFDVDIETVWETLQSNIPDLKKKIQCVLNKKN